MVENLNEELYFLKDDFYIHIWCNWSMSMGTLETDHIKMNQNTIAISTISVSNLDIIKGHCALVKAPPWLAPPPLQQDDLSDQFKFTICSTRPSPPLKMGSGIENENSSSLWSFTRTQRVVQIQKYIEKSSHPREDHSAHYSINHFLNYKNNCWT